MSAHRGIVDAQWLKKHRGDRDVIVVDVRWSMQPPTGRERYESGHIEAAHYLDLDTQLSRPVNEGPGRHPLPGAERLAAALASIGIDRQMTVVCYDDRGGAIAARLWWLLRYYGAPVDAVVLDGGVQAWTALGESLSTTTPDPRRVEPMSLAAREWMVVDRAGVQQALSEGALVLDARGRNRYRGEIEPIDPRPGHIPGSVNAPYGDNLSASHGPLLPLDVLRERYESLGAFEEQTVICSCGSGVTACHDIWTLNLLGRTSVKLYEGSWSDWSSDDSLPAATGPGPGG
jgi:thiosulfate/3-mercaptopyruvate sulfurtransferase